MELITPDFAVEDKNKIFNSEELKFIDATVNGYELPKNHVQLIVSIRNKIGFGSWPRMVAMLIKTGVIKCLSIALALTISIDEVPTADVYEFDNQAMVRVRTRRETEGFELSLT